jgi:pimeloyl-ACP methyl ester carboxylesterase
MAAFAADAAPSTAEAMVLLAPPAPPDGRQAERYRARFDDDLAARVREAEALVAADRGDETLTGVGFLYCDDARVTAAAFLSYYGPAAPSDVRDFLRDSARPVLVIAGSEDEISAGLPAALGPILSPPRQRLVEIDGADHFFRDLYAYDVVEAVQDFVDETAGP